jgi:hypothetical protein
MKQRRGARPVPGPTMTRGGGGGPWSLSGIRSEPGLVHIGTFPPFDPCSAKKDVQTPNRSIVVLLVYLTIAAVISIRFGCGEGPEDIEYSLECRGRQRFV